ncbi:acyl-CoA dehydrogenase family protein [Rhodoferax aquaticus]|uniref:acyl-CoA dehydrogenase family protein n=1 Tax=Rhodoferax aquaticus TaxID=2527691 RepID=UPI00143DBC09|nr:acyl-CoA dehydrogenase family protein [Rhodoferax aquaticus]
MTTASTTSPSWAWVKQLQSPQIAAQHAHDVDQQARFPRESLAAFQSEKLLNAPVSVAMGGKGLTMRGQCELVALIAQRCGSSAMVLAMHYSQLACLTRNAQGSAFFTQYLRDMADKQWLLGSMTSEVGTFGDTRSSICAVEREGDQFVLNKEATTGSYCAYADAILVTARRASDAQASDQVLVLVDKHQAQLTHNGVWDTMGMRGTCSPGFSLRSQGGIEQVFPTPYSEIASQSMVPYSHTLWSALWWGLAYSAYDKAATLVRNQARKNPGQVPPAATRLAELMVKVQAMRRHWQGVADEFDALVEQGSDTNTLQEMGWALQFNSLKTAASQAAPAIIQDALLILGIPGFNNQGPLSVSRALRDSLSGALMVSNERIAAKSASMLLVYKDQ